MRQRDKRGENNYNSKLTTRQVVSIRLMYATGDYDQVTLAKVFGVTQKTISSIVTYDSWQHVGPYYERWPELHPDNQ